MHRNTLTLYLLVALGFASRACAVFELKIIEELSGQIVIC
jgi:hypothetical protein